MTEPFETKALGLQPDQAVAAACAHVIAELSRMVYEGFQHDEKSEAMVMGTMAFLTSVLDGKAANPALIGKRFADACEAVNHSLLDEVSRCQHFLSQTLEQKHMAEGRALVAEMHERWYLRLRDDPTCDLSAGYVGHDGEIIRGEQLDIAMEDLDAEQGKTLDPGNDIDTP